MDIGSVAEERTAKAVQIEDKMEEDNYDNEQYENQYDDGLNYMGPKGKGKGVAASNKGDKKGKGKGAKGGGKRGARW